MKVFYLIVVFAACLRVATGALPDGQYLYAVEPAGNIRIYDMNKGHALVQSLMNYFPASDTRGAAAAKQRFYVFYNHSGGHVLCFNLRTNQILWDKIVNNGGVDRGSVTPDGTKLYVPTYESNYNSPFELVLDAQTGNKITQISMPTQTHDTLVSLDGTTVYMENKNTSDRRLRAAATSTNTVKFVSQQTPNGGLIAPFSVTHDGTLAICDVYGTSYSWRGLDLHTGQWIFNVPLKGTLVNNHGNFPHGIGMTPDETEAWVCDRGDGKRDVQVFDLTRRPPVYKLSVTLTNDNPHWLTFDVGGRYCYVAGEKGTSDRPDIISVATHSKIGQLGFTSEDILEVDFSGGSVVRLGNQFGPGRK